MGYGLFQGPDIQHLVNHYPRHHPKRNHVGQGIELFSHFSAHLQKACGKSVQKVEDHGQSYQVGGKYQVALERKHQGNASAEQISGGEGIRDVLFDLHRG